jgi:hypothetical protein
VRLHDDPLMRFSGIQGLKVETAGLSGVTGAEGNLIGVVDAARFRDAILHQREILQEGGTPSPTSAAVASESDLLVEIRDLLKSIDSKT